jgi:hypothetical protein
MIGKEVLPDLLSWINYWAASTRSQADSEQANHSAEPSQQPLVKAILVNLSQARKARIESTYRVQR